MKRILLLLALLAAGTSGAWADVVFYNTTTTDTLDTVVYSATGGLALGDEIALTSAGIAKQAQVELFNVGGAGTFDAILGFYTTGGAQIGSDFVLPNVISTGNDVIDLTFGLGGLDVPQNPIFLVSAANASSGVDLGVDMFEPPTVGSSANSFMEERTAGGISALASSGENVYFQLSGSAAMPEPSSLQLLCALMAGVAIFQRRRNRRSA